LVVGTFIESNIMKKTEIILGAIILLGLILRNFDLPGSGIFIVLPSLVLSIIYGIFGISLLNDLSLNRLFARETYSELGRTKIVVSIISGIVLSINIIGILFYVQYYSEESANLLIGLPFLVLTLIVSLLFYTKFKIYKYINIIFRGVIILVVGIITLFVF
jgi:hypothetical protein